MMVTIVKVYQNIVVFKYSISYKSRSIQWYKGIIFSLFHKLNLREQINFESWWEQQSELDPIERLYQFVEQVLLRKVQNNRIFIFIDNINSLLSLNFPINDFFIWIR